MSIVPILEITDERLPSVAKFSTSQIFSYTVESPLKHPLLWSVPSNSAEQHAGIQIVRMGRARGFPEEKCEDPDRRGFDPGKDQIQPVSFAEIGCLTWQHRVKTSAYIKATPMCQECLRCKLGARRGSNAWARRRLRRSKLADSRARGAPSEGLSAPQV